MHIQEFIQHILLRSYLKYSPSFTWMFLFLFWEGVLLMERNLLTEKIFSSVIWHIYILSFTYQKEQSSYRFVNLWTLAVLQSPQSATAAEQVQITWTA